MVKLTALISVFISGLAIGIAVTNIAYKVAFHEKSAEKRENSEDRANNGGHR